MPKSPFTLASVSRLTLLSDLWYNIPITGTDGGLTSATSANLLVGGACVYSPLIVKE